MKAPNVRDIINRTTLKKHHLEKKGLKALKINSKLKVSFNSKMKLSSFPTKQARNRCIISGRGRAILAHFKLSRLEFSKSAKFYNLPGVEKASW